MKRILFTLTLTFAISLSFGQLKLLQNGNFGIGTLTPSVKVHVVGPVIRLDTAGPTQFEFYNSATLNGYLRHDQTHMTLLNARNGDLRFGANNTVQLYLLPSGRLGVGQASPTEMLDVNGAIRLGNTGNTNAGAIRWTGSDFEGYTGSTWSSLTGGADDLGNHTASQILNMSSFRITNLAAPSSGTDAANKTYVDAHTDADSDATNEYNTNVNLNGTSIEVTDGGGTLSADLSSLSDDLGNHTATQDLDMASNKVTNVATPTAGTDAATKAYVDAHTDADSDATNEYNTSVNLNGTMLEVTDGGGTKSADLSGLGGGADNLGNHTATLDLDMANNKVTNVATPTAGTDGATKAYVDAHTDADADATNEYNTSVTLNGTTLEVTDGGGTKSADLSGLGGGADNLGNHTATQNLNMGLNKVVNMAAPSADTDAATKAYVDVHTDGDADDTNEYNTSVVLNGTTLEVNDGGGTKSADLSSLQDGVDDADADPTNEYNTSVVLNGTTLEVNDGGGTKSADLSSLQDGVDDADADPTNELITNVALAGSTLEITDAGGVNSVDLSSLGGGGSPDTDWTISGDDIYSGNSGNVGIGVTDPDDKLEVDGNARVYGNFKVGQDRGANAATLLVGKDRTEDGIARMDLISDASAYPNFGLRLIRFANGESQITHKGSQAMVFNAADLGGTYDFRIQGLSRVLYTGGAVTPGSDGITNLGDGTHRWADIWCVNGVIQTSDERYKDNIEDLGYGLDEILKLRPVTYTWKDNPELGTKLGLIAQEVRPVIGEVVRDYDITATTESIKRGKLEYEISPIEKLGMNYTSLIPVLIKGIQQQNALIEEQKEINRQQAELIQDKQDEIEDLKTRLSKIEALLSLGKEVKEVDPDNTETVVLEGQKYLLKQNSPNPFSRTTEIYYELPKVFETAAILIYDLNGTLLKKVDLRDGGTGVLQVEAYELAAGTYEYALSINDSVVAVRKMILTK